MNKTKKEIEQLRVNNRLKQKDLLNSRPYTLYRFLDDPYDYLYYISTLYIKSVCDNLMQKVNKSTFSRYYNRIRTMFDTLNNNLSEYGIIFTQEYIDLKLEELQLNLDKKSVPQYANIAHTETSGFVYFVTNPSFGKNVVKIGLTTKSIEGRLNGLNSASVPFEFRPICVLYSDNCFDLEADLHNRFDEYRVNKINHKREFFKIPFDVLEKVIHEEYDSNAVFDYDTDEDFYDSGYKEFENFVDRKENV